MRPWSIPVMFDKVFIWAIPFSVLSEQSWNSEAVSAWRRMGAAADIEKIKEQLGQVTGGLSEHSMVVSSLIFSLFVMFPTSVMQKRGRPQ